MDLRLEQWAWEKQPDLGYVWEVRVEDLARLSAQPGAAALTLVCCSTAACLPHDY